MEKEQVYYAISGGDHAGVYESWNECKKYCIGGKNIKYKKFNIKEDAEEFVKSGFSTYNSNEENAIKTFAFVDGSFNPKTNAVGYGVVLSHTTDDGKDQMEITYGCIESDEAASLRNVAGELIGTKVAIELALKHGYKDIVIFYDYIGISSWATGAWVPKKELTKTYKAYVDSVKDKIDIKFIKVAAHTGVKYNEIVDQLAKSGSGILKNVINEDTSFTMATDLFDFFKELQISEEK